MTTLRRLVTDGRAVAGMTILGLFCAIALLAPLVAPADPLIQTDILRTRFLAPLTTGPDGVFHLLGTDRFGRDLFSRLVFGTRISLTVGLLSVAVSITLGGAIGVFAGVRGGTIEQVLMAVTDAVLAMPRLVLLLALVTLWETSLILVVLVLGFTGWMSVARLARAEVKSLL